MNPNNKKHIESLYPTSSPTRSIGVSNSARMHLQLCPCVYSTLRITNSIHLYLQLLGVSQLVSKISLIKPEMAVFRQNVQKKGKGHFTISFVLMQTVVLLEFSMSERNFFPMLRRFCVFFVVHNFHLLFPFLSLSHLHLLPVSSPLLSPLFSPLLPSLSCVVVVSLSVFSALCCRRFLCFVLSSLCCCCWLLVGLACS